MAEMGLNASGLNDDSNTTNSSFVQSHNKYTESAIFKLYVIIWYVVLALGVPGNVLSAIVWLRRRVASNNSSAVYLAALSIDDLAYLVFGAIYIFLCDDNWICAFCLYLLTSASDLESLLVLSFSVERLIAILRPLQVCTMLYGFYRAKHVVSVSRPFVCLSVTLMHRGRIGWTTGSSKLITPRSHNIGNLVQAEHPQNSDGIGVGSMFSTENLQYL